MAADIVEFIYQKDASISEIIKHILNEYDVDYNDAERDCNEVIKQLLDKSIFVLECKENIDILNINNNYFLNENSEEVASEVFKIAKSKHIPIRCKFNITNKCNQKCEFCYNGNRR